MVKPTKNEEELEWENKKIGMDKVRKCCERKNGKENRDFE